MGNTVIIGGLAAWVTHKAKERDADPLRHVLGDNNWWKGCSRSCGELWPDRCNWSSNEYKCALVCGETFVPPYNATYTPAACNESSNGYLPRVDCTCVHDAQESASHLSPMGILFTIFFTYFGFSLFLIGNLWNANILDKCRDIRHKYRVLRGLSQDSDY